MLITKVVSLVRNNTYC